MSPSLVTCPSCHRHLRADGAAACRFCGADVAAHTHGVPAAAPPARRSRAAAAAAALTAAMTVGACSRDVPPAPAPVYGAPADMGPPDASGAQLETRETPPAPVYGGPPPVDTAPPETPQPERAASGDAGANAATKQGAGVARDAGAAKTDPKLMAPAYGAPPPRTAPR